jgi:hypothetical protein
VIYRDLHGMADVLTLVRCECGAEFSADREDAALARWAEHCDKAESRERHPTAGTP